MWLFRDEEEMLLYVLEGLSRMGGDMLRRTLNRLMLEGESRHKLLLFENSIRHTLDKAGHVFMEHLGRIKAKEKEVELVLPIREGGNTLSISNCPNLEVLRSEGLEPVNSYVCSLCRGYMSVYGERLGLGSLNGRSFTQGKCSFHYGGEGNGHS